MKNIENILEKLLEEQKFLSQMQKHIADNYGIMLQNQRQNTDNHELVIHNQTTIIKNQEIIVNNQINIVRNQKQIVQNQVQLEVILETQAYILNTLKELKGEKESIESTQALLNRLQEEKSNKLSEIPFNNPSTL